MLVSNFNFSEWKKDETLIVFLLTTLFETHMHTTSINLLVAHTKFMKKLKCKKFNTPLGVMRKHIKYIYFDVFTLLFMQYYIHQICAFYH